MIQQIIVSGQTIAETSVLNVAIEKGIETGGWAVRGWMREIAKTKSYAPAGWLGDKFGLQQCASTGEFKYRSRDAYKRNIAVADATILFCYPIKANRPNSVQQFIIEECARQSKTLLSISSTTFALKAEGASWLSSDASEFAALVHGLKFKVVHIVAPRLLVDLDAGRVAAQTVGKLIDNLKAMEAKTVKTRKEERLELLKRFLSIDQLGNRTLMSWINDHPGFAFDLIDAYAQYRIKEYEESSLYQKAHVREVHSEIWEILESDSVRSIQESSL